MSLLKKILMNLWTANDWQGFLSMPRGFNKPLVLQVAKYPFIKKCKGPAGGCKF